MPSIDARTRTVAVLGHPIEHSLSPLIHNTAFEAQGLNFAYFAADVPPREIEAAVAGLRALGLAGANVTIPHKQSVLALVDELSPQARAVGAVNTIVCRPYGDGRPASLYGDNTDVAGFLEPLAPLADRLRGTEMLVLGAGGAARAVVYALLTTFQPARLTLAARTLGKARQILSDLRPHDPAGALDIAPESGVGEAVCRSRLIVNTTPVGMHPHRDATPLEGAALLSTEHVVYDLIYNPRETRLLRDAAARGAVTVGGLDMLIGQAAAAYRQWTGRDMPVETVRGALAARFATSS